MPAPHLYEASDWEKKRVRRAVAALSLISDRLEECLTDAEAAAEAEEIVGPVAPSPDDVRSLAKAARKALDEFEAPHPEPEPMPVPGAPVPVGMHGGVVCDGVF